MGRNNRVPVRSNVFIVILSIMILGCAMFDEADGGGGTTWSTNAYISSSKAVVNEWYSGDVTVYSNYVETVEYHSGVDGTIPPGLTWDPYTGVFSGTPTELGIYNVTVYYRDANKGTHAFPNLEDNKWYTTPFEIEVSRFKQPEGGGTGYMTVSNKTEDGIWVYVDGIEKGWVNPNSSKQFPIRAGMRAFTAKDIDGNWSEEAVYEIESGAYYTVDFDFLP